MTTEETKPAPTFHYYAATGYGWAVGATRQAAIAKCAADTGADIIRRQIKPNGGLYCWTCRVELPIDARYHIENYAPATQENGERVPKSYPLVFLIVNAKGHGILDPDGHEAEDRLTASQRGTEEPANA